MRYSGDVVCTATPAWASPRAKPEGVSLLSRAGGAEPPLTEDKAKALSRPARVGAATHSQMPEYEIKQMPNATMRPALLGTC